MQLYNVLQDVLSRNMPNKDMLKIGSYGGNEVKIRSLVKALIQYEWCLSLK